LFQTNPLKFASAADDFLTEAKVIEKFGAQKVLLKAGGGCNFLNLLAAHPNLQLDCFDADIVELDHLKSKLSALKRNDLDRLNYLSAEQVGLNQCGRYESLLRIFRRFVYEIILEHDSFTERFWESEEVEKQKILNDMFSTLAWQRAFEMFFARESLEAIVGGQWSEDSCGFVRKNIESLLLREDRSSNWFLKHLFKGEYDENAYPPYLDFKSWDSVKNFEIFHSELWDLEIESYQLLSLGNYVDFLDRDEAKKLEAVLKTRLEKGAVIILRTLRDEDPFVDSLKSDFKIDRAWGEELLKQDKSFLYSHQAIAIKET
tara:strand:- start:44047 stop:44997 length:951 start_codon:yes stop_codon:yes gene_type:complete